MSATATVNRLALFLNVLRKHRLVEPAKLDKLEGSPLLQGEDPRPLARQLVQWGWLTQYQMQLMSQGQLHELVLGPYRILDCVGEGGMGQVFKAKHLTMNRLVALKVIRKELLTDESQVKRFYQEVQASAQLVHPHIMVAFDAGCDDDRHYLAMEFAEGSDLSALVQEKGPLPVAQACEYIQQAALGLQYAHERGLVHRDIKPSNLFLCKPHLTNAVESSGGSTRTFLQKQLIKILDLGLALFQDDERGETSLTRTGMVVGTPDYIAPEQAQDSHAVDIRSDLYSLGCTFYFLLAGRRPFEAGSAMDVMLMHYADEATPIEQWRPDTPREVCAILRKLMAKQPEDRFQTPADLAAALEPFTAGKPTAPVLTTPQETAEVTPRSPRQLMAFRLAAKNDQTNLMSAASLPGTVPVHPATTFPRLAALLVLAPIVAVLVLLSMWKTWPDKESQAATLRQESLHASKVALEKPPAEQRAEISVKPFKARENPPVLQGDRGFQAAFQLRNLKTMDGPFKIGDAVILRYEVVNTSTDAVQVPEGKLGIRQHWIERLGPDPLLPNPGKSARMGKRYAAGGLLLKVDPVVPAGKSYTLVRSLPTGDLLPGRYRYYVEYRNDRNTVLHSLSVEFEVLATMPG